MESGSYEELCGLVSRNYFKLSIRDDLQMVVIVNQRTTHSKLRSLVFSIEDYFKENQVETVDVSIQSNSIGNRIKVGNPRPGEGLSDALYTTLKAAIQTESLAAKFRESVEDIYYERQKVFW